MPEASLHTVPLQDWFRRMQGSDAAAAEELLRAAGDRMERLALRCGTWKRRGDVPLEWVMGMFATNQWHSREQRGSR